jgi:tRNA (guanine-N7-)-methyltransferase
MHRDGRLSFRRRVKPIAADGELPCVIGGEDPPPLGELVGSRAMPVEVEVGSGKGAFLVAAATARPDVFFVGIEASSSYGQLAAARLRQAKLTNAVVLVDNAALYLDDRVPEGALQRVHVYFPDPWPKRRHRKRRFFNADAPALLHRCLAPGGLALVATDDAAYAGQLLALMGASPLFERDREEERRLAGGPPGHGFSPTHFERKYLEEARIIRRYAFRRVDRPPAGAR